ncbi:hypothetical protein PHLGIDRAFT_177935 [Phlebiopsis gigantea 11061_1 CR5-6]|uniref:Uncharacterized protein n=1 Tax=Phlebiopsis gigantea (strain 11061_1 CR5-6) TaxID=745531 RepID=A0A0C3PGL6_PHLG1|nr:hypothetical protein PHLGIDRAFT_177935 [Phlebiopsis gigantea 11061_1 CR5-6]
MPPSEAYLRVVLAVLCGERTIARRPDELEAHTHSRMPRKLPEAPTRSRPRSRSTYTSGGKSVSLWTAAAAAQVAKRARPPRQRAFASRTKSGEEIQRRFDIWACVCPRTATVVPVHLERCARRAGKHPLPLPG